MTDRTPTTLDLFNSRYEKDEATGCWLWDGNGYNGYGCFSIDGKRHLAHRVAYELFVGQIPDGALIDHKCRVRHCVNPGHLQLADRKTNGENVELSKANTSGVRGVAWDKRNHKWVAQVKHNYRMYWAGRHASLGDAEAAVIALRNKLFTNNLADRGI